MQIPLEEYGQLKVILSRSVEVCLATIGVCVFYASTLVGAFFYSKYNKLLGYLPVIFHLMFEAGANFEKEVYLCSIGWGSAYQKGFCMYTLAFGIGFCVLGILFSVLLTGEFQLAIFLVVLGICCGLYLDCREFHRKKEENLQAEKIKGTEVYLKLIASDRSYILSQLSEREPSLLEQPNLISMIPWTIEGLNELLDTWEIPAITDGQFRNLILAIGQTPGYQLTGEFRNHSFCVDYEYWKQELQPTQENETEIF